MQCVHCAPTKRAIQQTDRHRQTHAHAPTPRPMARTADREKLQFEWIGKWMGTAVGAVECYNRHQAVGRCVSAAFGTSFQLVTHVGAGPISNGYLGNRHNIIAALLLLLLLCCCRWCRCWGPWRCNIRPHHQTSTLVVSSSMQLFTYIIIAPTTTRLRINHACFHSPIHWAIHTHRHCVVRAFI